MMADLKKKKAYGGHSKQVVKLVPVQATTRVDLVFEKFGGLLKVCKAGQGVVSKPVGSEGAPRIKWELMVYPNGKNEACKGLPSVMVRLASQEGNGTQADFDVFLVKEEDGGRVDVQRASHKFHTREDFGPISISSKKVQQSLHSDGALIVACELKFHTAGKIVHVEEMVYAGMEHRPADIKPHVEEMVAAEEERCLADIKPHVREKGPGPDYHSSTCDHEPSDVPEPAVGGTKEGSEKSQSEDGDQLADAMEIDCQRCGEVVLNNYVAYRAHVVRDHLPKGERSFRMEQDYLKLFIASCFPNTRVRNDLTCNFDGCGVELLVKGRLDGSEQLWHIQEKHIDVELKCPVQSCQQRDVVRPNVSALLQHIQYHRGVNALKPAEKTAYEKMRDDANRKAREILIRCFPVIPPNLLSANVERSSEQWSGRLTVPARGVKRERSRDDDSGSQSEEKS